MIGIFLDNDVFLKHLLSPIDDVTKGKLILNLKNLSFFQNRKTLLTCLGDAHFLLVQVFDSLATSVGLSLPLQMGIFVIFLFKYVFWYVLENIFIE